MVTGYKHWEEAIGLDYYSVAEKNSERWNRCPHIISNLLSIFRKTSISALLTMPKPLTLGITIKCGKTLNEMGIPDHLSCLLRSLYAGQEATVRTRHGTTDWFQIGKGDIKAVYCHPAYLIYMQSTSWEMLDWMKHKLE